MICKDSDDLCAIGFGLVDPDLVTFFCSTIFCSGRRRFAQSEEENREEDVRVWVEHCPEAMPRIEMSRIMNWMWTFSPYNQCKPLDNA